MNQEEKTKRIKCWNCGYEWNTRSDHIYVSCPSCLQKVLSKNPTKKDQDKIMKEIKQEILDVNYNNLKELKNFIDELIILEKNKDDHFKK